jgi:hypothetical protein
MSGAAPFYYKGHLEEYDDTSQVYMPEFDYWVDGVEVSKWERLPPQQRQDHRYAPGRSQGGMTARGREEQLRSMSQWAQGVRASRGGMAPTKQIPVRASLREVCGMAPVEKLSIQVCASLTMAP